ncbi:MAG TPA: ribosomal protein S18-alanine N-acetyltransferase [Acetobacteraceae bacterium]
MATSAHAAALAEIHRAAFPPGEAWGADAIALQLGLPGGFGLLDPCGGMALARVAADEAELLTLAVAPQVRRRGIGRRLLIAAMERMAQAGAGTLFLEVSEANQAAQALYRSAGFRQAARRRGYYPDGADALVLSAALSPCVTAKC